MKVYFYLAICLIAVLLSQGNVLAAEAKPSFDCAKASTSVEKTICSSPNLSEKDKELSISYATDLGMLSDQGKELLRNGQRQWVKVLQKMCDDAVMRHEEYWPTSEQCIARKYDERLTQLKHAVEAYDGITIQRVDKFEARRSSENGEASGYDSGFVTTFISYPRIDAPTSSQQELWNKKMMSIANSYVGANPEGENTDYWSDYSILTASTTLISTEVNGGFYGHGTPHGNSDQRTIHWLIGEERELRVEDVFDMTKSWQSALITLCFNDLSKREKLSVKSPDKLGNMPLDIGRWKFEKDGLKIHFNPYEVGPYAAGSPEVLIPWEELSEYLVTNAPIPSHA